MIKQFLLFILLSLSSLAALAVPTVTDVEATIVSGDYVKAKEQLKEVLKVKPDSVVANKYMLEVIKIEYAGSLKPSVEYKIYEDALKQIAADKAKRIEAERIAAEEKRSAEIWASVRTFFAWLIGLAVLGAGGFFLWMRTSTILAKRKWVKSATDKSVHINKVLSKALGHDEGVLYFKKKSEVIRLDAISLRDDNNDVIEIITENGDYDVEMIDNHFKNAYKFIDRHGIE